MSEWLEHEFDIDRHLNPYIPRRRLNRLVYPLSYFLGHRTEKERRIGSLLQWFWACVGAIAGILVVEAVYSTEHFKGRGAPLILGSLGASAILKYNAIDSPLSQPRNAVLGQLFSSIIGVSVSKLFLMSPSYIRIRFVGGALAVGLSSVFMSLTNTVHPPAGATALMAVTSNEVTDLGWFLVPLIVLGAVLMVGVACVINNVQRRWPAYWWTPVDLDQLRKDGQGTDDQSFGNFEELDVIQRSGRDMILIDGKKIIVPGWLILLPEESVVLEVLLSKIDRGLEAMNSRDSDTTFVGREDPTTKV